MPADIIIPSEIQSREFDGKLLTACILAERGHSAIIGARHEIHNQIANLKADVYLAKDMGRPSKRILRLIRGLGLAVAALDEEGVIWPSEAGYYGRRTTPETVASMDMLFAWGPRSHALTLGIPGMVGAPVVTTGNPRNDMLRPELRVFYQRDVDKLRARFGPFILINSNFGMVNPITYAKSREPAIMTAQHPDVIARFERRKKIFSEMCQMLPVLCAAFPKIAVVVRPHPSENMEAWANLKAQCPNLHVIREGEVIPWLLAADAMIHNECSTGVESFMLDRVSISYKGFPRARDGGLSADQYSEIAETVEEVISNVRRRLENGPIRSDASYMEALKAHYDALDGTLAAERLATQLSSLSTKRPRQIKFWIKAQKRGFEKRLLALIPGHKAGAAHNRHRYPGVSPAELTDKIERLSLALGRFHNVRAEHIGGQIYRLRRK